MTPSPSSIGVVAALAVIASILGAFLALGPRSGDLIQRRWSSAEFALEHHLENADVTRPAAIPLPNSFSVFVPSEINGTMMSAMEQDLVSLGVAEMFMDLNGGASIEAPNVGLWFSEQRRLRVRERVVPVVTFWDEPPSNGTDSDRPVILGELFSIARWLCCFLWQDALLVRLNDTAVLLPRPADSSCAQITHPLPRLQLALE